MPKIVNLIPPQSFEVIRDRITEILIDEINNQQTLAPDPLDITYKTERSTPVQSNECPLINVSIDRGDFAGKHTANVDGSYPIYVDCFFASPSKGNFTGDQIATINVQRLLGVCRAVIANPVYKTLGFAQGFIGGVECQNFVIAQPDIQDAASVAQGRLTIMVRASEVTEKLVPILLSEFETTIKVDSSLSGFHYSKPEAI